MSQPSKPNSRASPGPWRRGYGADIVAATGDTVIDVFPGYDEGDGYSTEPELRIKPADEKLILAAPEMASMLRELEWSGHDCVALCPVCGQRPERTVNVPGDPVPGMPGFVTASHRAKTIPGGHSHDCRLGTLLDRLGRE